MASTVIASFLVRGRSGSAESLKRGLGAVERVTVKGEVGGRLVVLGECDAREESLEALARRILDVPGVADLALVSAFTDSGEDE